MREEEGEWGGGREGDIDGNEGRSDDDNIDGGGGEEGRWESRRGEGRGGGREGNNDLLKVTPMTTEVEVKTTTPMEKES